MPVVLFLPLLETIAALVAGTIAVRVTSDLYDKVAKKS
jgi:hypothetical protein